MLAKVTIPHSTGLPEDEITNTWAFQPLGAASRTTATSEFNAALDVFYTALQGSFSAAYMWTGMTVEYIDLDSEVPRVPYSTNAISTTTLATASSDLPAEVALCLSLVGLRLSGVNMRRRRGRVYLGPFSTGAVDIATALSTLCTTAANAGEALRTGTDYELCVYSRYTHHDVPVGRNIGEKDANDDLIFPEDPTKLPASFNPVQQVYCDNAWDTQRRRGPKATLRIIGI